MFEKIARSLLKRRFEEGLPITVGILQASWTLMVGDYFAAHTRPVRLKDQTLRVIVSGEPRLKEFRHHRERLLARINAMMPWPLKELELVLAGAQQFDLQAPAQATLPPLGGLSPREEALLEQIEDEEVRAKVARLRRLARGRAERGGRGPLDSAGGEG